MRKKEKKKKKRANLWLAYITSKLKAKYTYIYCDGTYDKLWLYVRIFYINFFFPFFTNSIRIVLTVSLRMNNKVVEFLLLFIIVRQRFK